MLVIDPEYEKQFRNDFKLYFSSLSSRGTQYAYFNVAPEYDVILSNSSTHKKGAEHGDRIMNYSVTELGTHFIKFQDKKFISNVRRIFMIPNDVYFVMHVAKINSLLNKMKAEEISIYFDINNNLIVCNKNDKYIDPKKNVVGWEITDYHIPGKLRGYAEAIIHSRDPNNPSVTKNMSLDHTLVGRVFFINVDMSEFKNLDGMNVFSNIRNHVRLLSLDGLSCVSFKEFIKKMKNTAYEFKLHSWIVDRAYLMHYTTFDNANVSIISFRPNSTTYTCPDLPVSKVDLGNVGSIPDSD